MTKRLVRIQVKPEQQKMMCKAFGVSQQTLRNILANRTIIGRGGNADIIRASAINIYGGRKLYEEL